jgi:hypothetical protein
MKRLCFVFVVLLLGLMTGSAGAIVWTGGGGNSSWINVANWDLGREPNASDDTQINGTSTVTLDTTTTVNLLRFGVTGTGTQTFNVGPDRSVTATGTQGELIAVAKTASNPTIINQTGGLVKAYQNNGGRLGELRLGGVTAVVPTYNLSDGTLDVEILRKNGSVTATNYLGVFNDTGGTVILRTGMRQFGILDPTWALNTWVQKQSTFAPGGVGEIAPIKDGSGTEGTIYIGWNSPTTWLTGTYAECYRSSSGTIVALDFLDADSYDNISNNGNASFDASGDILNLNFLFTPSLNATFDIWKIVREGNTGSGYFDTVNDNLAGYFTQAWVDLGGVSGPETFRLTYVPEPATIALLGLGSLIAVRRRKK